MGEAKRRKAAGVSQPQTALPSAEVQARVHDAVMRTMQAFSVPGMADCIYHAAATVGALKAAGVDARMSVGAAWWAVGPAAGDTVVHGFDTRGRMVADLAVSRRNPDSPTADIDPEIIDMHALASYRERGVEFAVDMTTYQLPEKARLISEYDGRPLNVTIPVEPYYWGRLPPQRGLVAAHPGQWSFISVPGLEARFQEQEFCQQIERVAEVAYAHPGADLDVFDISTGEPVAKALEEDWHGFRDMAAITSP